MNKAKRFFKCLISIVLTVAMLITGTLTAFTNSDTPKQYVKDIIFVYGDNLEDATDNLPEGYTMLDTDLNQGAAYVFAVDDVYLAYSTTTDPDEAITDIRMMNMNGGFVMSDYEEQINNVTGKVRDLAEGLKDAAEEFVENYNKGYSGAKSAYISLNYFTVDEAGGKGLADYLIHYDVPDNFYLKLLLNAHTDILSTILSAFAMGVQRPEGDTWLDRLAAIEDPEEIWDDDYWDKATVLYPHFESFYNTYDSIDHDLFRNGDGEIIFSDEETGENEDVSEHSGDGNVNNTGMELFFEIAYDALDNRSFGNGLSISEWLVTPDLYEENLYPLIDILTPGEYAMFSLSGLMFMTLATSMNDEVYNNYRDQLAKELPADFKCSVWYGVDVELFRSSIAITDEANQVIAETKAEREFNNDGDTASDEILKSTQLVASIGAVALGTGLILATLSAGSFASALSGAMYSTFGILTYMAGTLNLAVGIVVLCVALVMAVIYLIVWIAEWYNEHHPDYTDIPEYMYSLVVDDEENTQFVLYEAVKGAGGSHDGKPADVNAWEGREWHAAYVTRDKSAGKPIEADFKIRLGDGRIDDGYMGVRAFGSVVSENFNRFADSDDVKGIYVSYRQEAQDGAYAKGKYISDMKIFSDKNDEKCKTELKNEGYSLYNVDLTSGSDTYTYIGYKTTNKASRALTDIRLCHGYSASQYNAGGANGTYAASGTVNGLTLYITRVSMFGTPILSDFTVVDSFDKAPKGYEPVNFFSGGPAVNINVPSRSTLDETNQRFIFFLPSVTYTEGTEYLGGIATIFDVIKNGSLTSTDSVEKMTKHLGYETLMSVTGNLQSEGAIIYSTTYNPYRAIYGVTAMSNGGSFGSQFSQSINYGGVSYSLATRFGVYSGTKAECDNTNRKNDSRLYVTSIYNGGTPMLADDIAASSDKEFTKEGFIPVSACLTGSQSPANISNAFNYTQRYGVNDGYYLEAKIPELFFFVRKEAPESGKYLTDLFLSSAESVLGGIDIDCDDLDKSYIMANLAASGAEIALRKNLNLEDSDNATYLGYAKEANSRTPIRDVILYYAGNNKKEPERKIVHNNITYHLVSDINLFCKENGENKKSKRVYLYYTTNPSAGDPIIDIKLDNNPIINGWQTVLTQNSKALYDDMNEFEDDMWFLHVKRQEKTATEYISEVVVGVGSKSEAFATLLAAGCDHFVNKDLNDNCGPASDYVYLGYKKTSDISEAIRDLKTTHNNNVTSFTKNGATYYKVNGNLNSFTSYFADDIYLYYTKDASAGEPIIELDTSSKSNDFTKDDIEWSTVVKYSTGDSDGKPSDLNDGAFGDYIYLLQGRATKEPSALASMIGNGSLIILSIFVLMSAACLTTVYVFHKKRKVTEAAKQSNNS